MNDIKFRHSLPIQLRFSDVDLYGHVNNSVYFTYYDLGKIDYFTFVNPSLDRKKEGVVVVNIEANFISQINVSENIVVHTAVTEIGNKSMTLLQRVVNEDSGEVKCTCKSILVAFSLEKGDSMEIPEGWKEAISAFEGRDLRKRAKTVPVEG